MEDKVFAKLLDDVVLNIFFKLEDDPRNWAQVACVSIKFSSLIHCLLAQQVHHHHPLHRLQPPLLRHCHLSAWWLGRPSQTCRVLPWPPPLQCPRKLRFRSRTPDETFRNSFTLNNNKNTDINTNNTSQTHEASLSSNSCSWSLFNDLYFDTVYNVSGSTEGTMNPVDAVDNSNSVGVRVGVGIVKVGIEYSVVSKRRKICP
ncbi:phytochrome a-associated f-box protein [Quercus suber]|uniref:Phytochrome a-associated f-box protein n=1 Tax=Quercus suber TaxID=58331 RepID=A0AAW0M4H1_QUESU